MLYPPTKINFTLYVEIFITLVEIFKFYKIARFSYASNNVWTTDLVEFMKGADCSLDSGLWLTWKHWHPQTSNKLFNTKLLRSVDKFCR